MLLMWAEPLTPSIRILDDFNMLAQVNAADGTLIATAPFVINREAHTGAFGEMNITSRDGGPRQTQRALVLLVRAALRFATGEGVRHVETRAPERLRAFAERFTGDISEKDGPTVLYRGDAATIQTRTLDKTNDAGDVLEERR